jgi:hypothetical protein
MNKIATFLVTSSTNKDKVYVAADTLWAAYALHSGTTMPNFKSKSYITTKNDDKNYDDIARKLITYSNTTKPDMVKEDSKLFKIPIYKNHDIDVFKNDPKPDSFCYMLIKQSVINFFKTKNEAINFIKSSF